MPFVPRAVYTYCDIATGNVNNRCALGVGVSKLITDSERFPQPLSKCVVRNGSKVMLLSGMHSCFFGIRCQGHATAMERAVPKN